MEQKPHWFTEHEKTDRIAFKQLNDKLDSMHIELQPYLQGAAGLGLAWKALVALGGIVFLWVQIKSMWN